MHFRTPLHSIVIPTDASRSDAERRDPRRKSVLPPVVLLALSLIAGCREGVAPFQPVDRTDVTGEPLRISFSEADDQAPAWSANGDSIYYTTEGLRTEPRTSWVLKRIAHDGGVATPVVVNLQPLNGAAIALSPDRSRLASVLPNVLLREGVCPGVPDMEAMDCVPGETIQELYPRLLGFSLSLSRLTSERQHPEHVDVAVDGIRAPEPGGPTVFTVVDHPFHLYFRYWRALLMRPTWMPGGDELIYSDGLALRRYGGGAEGEIVPESTDGIYPAISPDGQWLAFSRPERGSAYSGYCRFRTNGVVGCTVERTDFTGQGANIVLMRIDGTDVRELGPGLAPAWTPDGMTLYFRRGDMIWRMATDGSGAEPVPGTEGGTEPAISPDGKRLAFSRIFGGTDYDIWVLEL